MKMSEKQRSAFAEWWPSPNSSWTVPYNVVQRYAPQMLSNSVTFSNPRLPVCDAQNTPNAVIHGIQWPRWMNYVPRKMPDVRSRYARFTIAPIYVRMLRYMDECYGLFTTKANHFHLERQKLRKMVTNPVALSVLLFVTIFHYSLENMSKFLWFYDASFVGEMEDSINTTDTPYKMHGDNW